MDATCPQPLHRLQIDLIDLEVAFDNSSSDMSYYLDLQTGQVVLVTGEAWRTIEAAAAKAVPGEDQDDVIFEAQLEDRSTPRASDWMHSVIEGAKRVHADTCGRYVPIPAADARAGYRDMQEFVGTVENEPLRERLWDAIQQRGAVRLFRDILARYPEERERWFEFEQECSMQRIMDWLAQKGVEPELEDDSTEATGAMDEESDVEC